MFEQDTCSNPILSNSMKLDLALVHVEFFRVCLRLLKKKCKNLFFVTITLQKEQKKKKSMKEKLHNKKEITSFAFRLCSMQICIVR